MPLRIFLSYARNDDQPLPGDDGKGFITTLLKGLEAYFTSFGPPTPEIFRDSREIAKSDQFDPILKEKISKSQIFLAVLSNNWIHRDWCLKELALFEQQWRQLGEHGVKSRVVVVGKNHIDDDARPLLLQGQDSYRFYEKDDEKAGQYREFFKRGKQDAAFYDRVEELARDLWSKAKVDEVPDNDTVPPPTPRSGRKIYLAKPAKDMDEPYRRMVDELEHGNMVVVPALNDELPDDGPAVTQFVDGALADAELSIHLLGEKERFAADDGTPLVKLQLDRAAARAGKDEKFRRIVWAPKIFGALERDPLAIGKRFAPESPRDKIVGDELSKFRDFLIDHLKNTTPRPVHAPGLPANARVYIYHKLEDTPYAMRLAKALEAREIEALTPSFDGDQAALTAWHLEQLRKCDGVVVCWGPNASEVFARASASELANWKEFGREKDFARRALIAGPPPGVRKEALIELPPRSAVDLVLDLTAYDVPTPEALGPLIEPLLHAAGSSGKIAAGEAR